MKTERLVEKTLAILPLLRCPLCGGAFSMQQQSLACPQNHTFDFSRKGYCNLAPSHNQQQEKYDAALFASRHAVLDAGFYQPVVDAMGELISIHHPTGAPFPLLDAGCGEGYYARQLSVRLPHAQILGVDISRDAVVAAARNPSPVHWLVGNLSRLPVQDHCLAFLVNILTPADYTEFARVLAPGGYFLKVIPGDEYLQQVRAHVAPHLSKNKDTYSNQRVLQHLKKHADIVQQHTIHQTLPVTPYEAACFARMTPMSFGLSQEVLEHVLFSSITIHLEVLCCRMHPH